MAPVKKSPTVFTTPPLQPKEKKPGQLTQNQLEQYFNEGYVIIKDLFSYADLQYAVDGVNELVNAMAIKLYDAGKIKDKYEHASFYERLTLLEKEWKASPVLLHRRGHLPEGFKYLWSHQKLLNIIEQLIGPNISGHPVWNLRTKTPGNVETTVPWHQDNAYFDEGADNVLIPTAWIPLIDANVNNGCMVVAAGGHRAGITTKHTCCAGPTWYVELDEYEMKQSLGIDVTKDAVVCEVPYGGVLLINNLIPHKSLLNKSDKIRWSLDLRWHRTQENNCFYGIKESVVMRKESMQTFEIDWEAFDGQQKQYKQEAEYAKEAGKLTELDIPEDDPIERDTIVTGPWMTRWEIVHHNKHTAGLASAAHISKP